MVDIRTLSQAARACRRPALGARLALLGVIAIACFARTAAAQQQPSSVESLRTLSIEQLGNIEITSVQKRPEPLSTAPASVFVITQEDIRRSGATSIPEVLRLAPNLEVAQLNAYQYTITARGFNSPESANKLLVLVDGRSVYTPLASTVFWETLNPLLDDIERIEVISGPGGTLYGANAVNGVINIITRNSADTQGGLVDSGIGNGQRDAAGRYGGRINDHTTYRVYGNGFQRSGTTRVQSTDLTSDSWQGGQTGFRVDSTLDRDAYTLQGDYYDNHVVSATEQTYGENLLGRWTRTLDNGSSLQVQSYFSNDVRLIPMLKDGLQQYDLQAQNDMMLGRHHVVWGAEERVWQEDIISSGSFFFAQPTKTMNVADLFAQDEITLAPAWRLTLGGKGEENTYSGFSFLPNVRLGWQVTPRHFLWSAVSQAVRDPSRIDRELQANGILVPSPDFTTEKVTAFELGYRSEPLSRLSLSVSTYYNLYTDLRTDAYVNGSTLPVQLNNGLEAHTYGIEAWATYGVTDWWRLRPGFNWMHEVFNLKSGQTDYSEMQSGGMDPDVQAQLRSEMELSPTVEFDTTLRYVGDVYRPLFTEPRVKAYVEDDARIGWHVTPAVEIALAGSNLLHAKHIEYNDPSTTPPRYISRTVYLSTRVRF